MGPREVDLRGLLFSFSSLEDDKGLEERDGSFREVVRGVMDLVVVLVVVDLTAPSMTAAPLRRVDMVMSE